MQITPLDILNSPGFYSNRYKYGYAWGDYFELGRRLCNIMQADKQVDKKILDVGCGMGWYTDILFWNVSKEIKGIDFSPIAIWYHAMRLYPQIDFECTDIMTYDFKGYDVFVLTEVLEHIEDDLGLLGRMPAGSRVYATVPFEKERMDVSHVREYTLASATERYSKILDGVYVEQKEQYIIITGTRKAG